MKPALLAALLLVSVTCAFAGDSTGDRHWPRWRGPHDDGSIDDASYPSGWPDERQVLWKARLAGVGCSTPAV